MKAPFVLRLYVLLLRSGIKKTAVVFSAGAPIRSCSSKLVYSIQYHWVWGGLGEFGGLGGGLGEFGGFGVVWGLKWGRGVHGFMLTPFALSTGGRKPKSISIESSCTNTSVVYFNY